MSADSQAMVMKAHSLRKNANGKRIDAGSIPSGSSLPKIDVGGYLAEIERILRATDADHGQRTQALVILRRWQFDEMLDDASRQKAKVLIWRCAVNDWRRPNGDRPNAQSPDYPKGAPYAIAPLKRRRYAHIVSYERDGHAINGQVVSQLSKL